MASAGGAGGASQEAFLKSKLSEEAEKREALFAAIKRIGEKIRGLQKTAPPRPNRTADEYDAEIARIEHELCTTGRGSAYEEKKILREIKDVKTRKADIAKFEVVQREIDALRLERDQMRLALDQTRSHLDELRDMRARVQVTDRLAASGVAVSPADLVSRTVPLQEGSVGRIIGRGGATLRQLEAEFAVGLDVDKKGGQVTVKGLPERIAAAVARIAEIQDEEERHVPLPRGLLQLLMRNKAEKANALQDMYGCRIHFDREAKAANVVGAPSVVSAVCDAFDAIDADHGEVELPANNRGLLPAVIGKKGANLKAIQEELAVEIDIERGKAEPKPGMSITTVNEADAPATIAVWGSAEEVAEAKARLEDLVETHREFTEELAIDADMSSFIVGKAGARIREFQREHGVYVHIVRFDEDGKPAASGGGGEGEDRPVPRLVPGEGEAIVMIRGTREKLRGGLVALNELRKEYEATTFRLSLNAAQARALIGKGGATVTKLREETGAQIDVDEGGERRERKAAEGEDAPRRRTRPALPAGEGQVRVRGTPEAVAAARAAVTSLVERFVEEVVEGVSDATIAALIGTAGATIKALQEETGAVIDIQRGAVLGAAAAGDEEGGGDEAAAAAAGGAGGGGGGKRRKRRGPGTVRLSGDRDSVSKARAAVAELAANNVEEVVDMGSGDLTGAIVGKGGANIRAVEEATGASVTVDKATATVICRGDAASVAAAAAQMRDAVERYHRENAALTVDVDLMPLLIGKGGATIKKLEEETGVQCDVDGKTGAVRLRGPEEAIAAAVAEVQRLTGAGSEDKAEVPLTADQIGPLLGRNGATLTRLQEEHGVVASVNRGKMCVVLRGSAVGVAAATAAVHRTLKDSVRVEQSVFVRGSLMGEIFGRGGANLRRLQQESGAMVDVPRRGGGGGGGDGEEIKVTVRGGVTAVRRAVAVLEALVAGRVHRIIRLLPAHAATLAGQGGPMLARAGAERHVSVELDAEDATLEIGGARDNVADALAAIEAVIRFYHPTEIIQVPVPASLGVALDGASPAGGGGKGKKGKGKPAAAAAAAAAPGGAGEEGVVDGEDGSGEDDGKAADATATATATATAAATKPKQLTLRGLAASAASDGHGDLVAYLSPAGDSVTLTSHSIVALANAKAALDAAVEGFAELNADLAIEPFLVRSIVGKGGASIKRLRAETGASIEISRDNIVSISGETPEIVAAAREAVNALADKLGRARIVLNLSNRAVGIVIGKGGATIRKVQEETKASMDMERESGNLAIRGTPEAVAAAKAAVEALLEEAGEAGAATAGEAKTLRCERDAVGAVIGNRGATIRELQEDTGASIDVMRDDCLIRIRGPAAAVEAAERRVRAILAEHSASTSARGAAASEEGAAAAPSAGLSAAPRPAGPPAGMAPGMGGAMGGGAPLSKNAARRARKKKAAAAAPAAAPAPPAPVPVPRAAPAPVARAPAALPGAGNGKQANGRGGASHAASPSHAAHGHGALNGGAARAAVARPAAAAPVAAPAPAAVRPPPGLSAPARVAPAAAAPAPAAAASDPMALLGLGGGAGAGGFGRGAIGRGAGRGAAPAAAAAPATSRYVSKGYSVRL